jgi:hypothetical protein
LTIFKVKPAGLRGVVWATQCAIGAHTEMTISATMAKRLTARFLMVLTTPLSKNVLRNDPKS